MKVAPSSRKISLRADQPIRLSDALGKRIQCLQGIVWITSTGMSEDIFLRPGESHQIDRKGLNLIESIAGEGILLLHEKGQPSILKQWLSLAADNGFESAERLMARRLKSIK